ncbi:hypothetical protein [Streptomyces phaeoluteigriseus]
MEQDERLLHASSFGAAAVEYAEHRPDYAQAAVRWALEPAPGWSGSLSRVSTSTSEEVALKGDLLSTQPSTSGPWQRSTRRKTPAFPCTF